MLCAVNCASKWSFVLLDAPRTFDVLSEMARRGLVWSRYTLYTGNYDTATFMKQEGNLQDAPRTLSAATQGEACPRSSRQECRKKLRTLTSLFFCAICRNCHHFFQRLCHWLVLMSGLAQLSYYLGTLVCNATRQSIGARRGNTILQLASRVGSVQRAFRLRGTIWHVCECGSAW